jgi:hypothetical protein
VNTASKTSIAGALEDFDSATFLGAIIHEGWIILAGRTQK